MGACAPVLLGTPIPAVGFTTASRRCPEPARASSARARLGSDLDPIGRGYPQKGEYLGSSRPQGGRRGRALAERRPAPPRAPSSRRTRARAEHRQNNPTGSTGGRSRTRGMGRRCKAGPLRIRRPPARHFWGHIWGNIRSSRAREPRSCSLSGEDSRDILSTTYPNPNRTRLGFFCAERQCWRGFAALGLSLSMDRAQATEAEMAHAACAPAL